MSLALHNLPKPVSPSPRRHSGVSLIEVLVSLLVIGVGMLGIASLQVYGLSATQVSTLHGQASVLTENLAELMRANPVAVSNGRFENLTIDTTQALPAKPGRLCRDPDHPCTADQLAAADLWLWENSARRLLPAGAVITIDCNGGAGSCSADGAHVVTMNWLEQERGGTQQAGYTTVIRP